MQSSPALPTWRFDGESLRSLDLSARDKDGQSHQRRSITKSDFALRSRSGILWPAILQPNQSMSDELAFRPAHQVKLTEIGGALERFPLGAFVVAIYDK